MPGGFPLQTPEAREAALDQLDYELEHRQHLSSALDKLRTKWNRTPVHVRAMKGEVVQIKLTIGELNALRLFGMANFNE